MNPETTHGDSKLPAALAAAAEGAAFGVLISRNFFATEKKIRHAIRTDFDVGDESFVRTMSDLLGPPLLPGNEVQLLQNGAEIFPAMLAAIASVQRSITLENFVWREGRTTRAFAEALAGRAAAGVEVHFLQDAFGCRDLHGPSLNLLRRSQLELEIYPLAIPQPLEPAYAPSIPVLPPCFAKSGYSFAPRSGSSRASSSSSPSVWPSAW